MYRDPLPQSSADSQPHPPAPPELVPIPFAGPWHYEFHFPRDPRGPRIARIALGAVLASHGLDNLAQRAQLLTSELTTNAVRHTTGGPLSLHPCACTGPIRHFA